MIGFKIAASAAIAFVITCWIGKATEPWPHSSAHGVFFGSLVVIEVAVIVAGLLAGIWA